MGIIIPRSKQSQRRVKKAKKKRRQGLVSAYDYRNNLVNIHVHTGLKTVAYIGEKLWK